MLTELANLELDTAEAVCLMEKAFPPSFFVIQTHLLSHLPAEIQLHGPFSPRTMYPWERFMGRLKQHVRNRAQAEASMAEGHKLREQVFYYNCMVAAHANTGGQSWHAIGDRVNSFSKHGQGLGYTFQNERERKQAESFVLQNSVHLSRWREAYDIATDMHTEARRTWRVLNPRARFPTELQAMEDFGTWLVRSIDDQMGSPMADEYYVAIRGGLSSNPTCYKHMTVNGSHYRTRSYDDTKRRTTDCIVTATFSQESVASTIDPNPVGDVLSYVGYVTDIITLTYGHLVEFNLLRVQWYRPVVVEDLSRGIRNLPHNAVRSRDESGFNVVNIGALVSVNEEPFIMADQVSQAILVPIEGDAPWCLVLPVESKFLYLADLLDTRAERGLEI